MFDATTERVRDLVAKLRGGHDDTPPESPPSSRELNPVTMAALELERQPFDDDVGAEALFADAAIDMQINALAQQLHEGEMLPILKGEAGSGKTSLLILLMSRTSEQFHYFVARGRENLRAERIMTDMLRFFTRDTPADSSQAFRELAGHLRRLVAEDRPAVLVVDDADAMSDAQINNILAMHDSLNPALGGCFHLLLCAGADFDLRLPGLQSRQLDSGRVMSANLRPLSRQRVAPFIEQRLCAAGAPEGDWLDPEALDRIAARGNSLPREIEAAAAEELNASIWST